MWPELFDIWPTALNVRKENVAASISQTAWSAAPQGVMQVIQTCFYIGNDLHICKS